MRRRWFMILALTMPTAIRAAEPTAGRQAIASLEERLKAGLRVQTPVDVAFCDRVVELVRTGKLPAQVVDSTYLWAVRRGRKYPFPAFRQAIRLKAERLGVSL